MLDPIDEEMNRLCESIAFGDAERWMKRTARISERELLRLERVDPGKLTRRQRRIYEDVLGKHLLIWVAGNAAFLRLTEQKAHESAQTITPEWLLHELTLLLQRAGLPVAVPSRKRKRKGAMKGAFSRAAAPTPQRRSEIARNAARARWGKPKGA